MGQIDPFFGEKLAAIGSLVIVGLAMLVSGMGLAYVSRIYPGRRAQLERWGGFMIISGLVLLGITFPSY